MAGIAHVLSIAKESLLTHQLSVQVASNNVANVDTPGYTRQSLELSTNLATPIKAGMLGGGVLGTEILRKYDQFMVDRLINQQSLLGNLQAQQESMRLVETVFNEAPGLAVNDLMNQFWANWQALSDNPELPAARQAVVQSAQLVVDQLHSMSAEMAQTKFDIGVSLDTAIEDVNSIVSQLATLNVQIAGQESGGHQANDLRDRRDLLLKDLSELVSISSFEDKNGATTVLLADGHTLVAGNEAWRVDWENNELIWVNRDSNGMETRKSLGDGIELGGKIGGWLEVRGNLIEGDPNNYLGRLDAFANALIREVNQVHTQGVGLILFGDTLTGAEQAKNTARLTTPVSVATATTSIPAGTIFINDRPVGEILGGTAVNGLAMAKAANAVDAINKAETGVEARLTTLVAGSSVDSSTIVAGSTISFEINGVTIDYSVAAGDVGDDSAFAANLVAEINNDLAAYNALATTTNPITIEAVVGDTTNGGAVNAIVLRNSNDGDSANIVIAGADPGLAGLTDGTYLADATHNTGEITIFSGSAFTVEAGPNDYTLAQLGMGGGNKTTTFHTGGTVDNDSTNPATNITFNLNGKAVTVNTAGNLSATQLVGAVQAGINAAFAPATAPVTVSLANGKIRFENSSTGDNSPIVVDSFTTNFGDSTIFGFSNFTAQAGGVPGDAYANDGKFTFSYENGQAGALLAGYDYFDELDTDNGSFQLWIYKDDNSLALPQPVTISLERAYSLQDAVEIINKSIELATNDSGLVTASTSLNSLRLTPAAGYKFAFANDTTNLLQVAGLNTFFTGSSAAGIGVNSVVADDLNYLAAARVGLQGQVFRGDNTNSLEITKIQSYEYTRFTGGTQNTLDGFYNSLVGEVANRTRTVDRSFEFNTLVNNQLNEMRDSVSGVSLDEEMANLVKFQHAYSAAARLITMSDEMLQTLLNSV